MITDNYRNIIKIRTFEELVLDLFRRNRLSGTTHTYIGEEATAVSVMKYVKENDKVFSNHRCHGHYLSYGGPEKLLLAEIMSRRSGLCQGRGGSQHIHYKNFYTNGIQGGIVPNAVGVALADKLRGCDFNTVVFLGDGTLGQGVVYESLNIASVYEVPVVFIIEDNQYAMSTRRTDVISGNIKSRIEGFDIKTFEIESTDVDELEFFFEEVFSYINNKRKPVCAVVHNYRLCAHSRGDDTRDLEEIELYKKNDPLQLVIDKIGMNSYKKVHDEYQAKFEKIVAELENEDYIDIVPCYKSISYEKISFLSPQSIRYVEGIREAFASSLKKNNSIVFLGEDIRDPYGGAFKATKGLSLNYDKQILNMPISEACMIGIAVGMGLNKMLSVVEIMFGDFITLGFDQLLNHASKYEWIYGNDISVPMIIRTPMGARRGYGPTHSQSLEKYIIGIPGIKVLALSLVIDPVIMYSKVFETINEPTVIIENKRLYSQKKYAIENREYDIFTVFEINNYGFPTFHFSIVPGNIPDIYILTYGGMVEECLVAADELMIQYELQIDVIIISQLSPMPILDFKTVIKGNAEIVVVEEGTKASGIGAEIIALLSENGIGERYYRIATPDLPIPNGIVLEEQIIPNAKSIVKEIKHIKNVRGVNL